MYAFALRAILLGYFVGIPCFAQQVGPQDIDKILERADKLFEEAKAEYEGARSKSSAQGFIDAGFKLEEARIKYFVLQEIGSPEKQKLAVDRLRAVNQLSKLIHDGKVAISGTPAESTPAKPSEPIPPKEQPESPKNPAPKAEVDVSKRVPVPDVAKQRDAEKAIKDLFKEQYSKKATADRKVLTRLLLDQSAKPQDDPAVVWVLCREAQDTAIQTCDVEGLTAAIEAAARIFDVDSIAMRNSALSAAGKVAKTPEEFSAVAEGLTRLVDDQIRNDQYDSAEKTIALASYHARKSGDAALGTRTTTRSKEVAESKTLFQGMKSALETKVKNPDDPTANLELGRFLCFVKGNWEVGLRFIVKGSDALLKSLAEKEIAAPEQIADRISMADGWFELADKEKSPLRKNQLQAHGKAIYESALPGSQGIARAKIEKRLDQLKDSTPTIAPPPPTASTGKVSITTAKLSAGSKTVDVAKMMQEIYDRNPKAALKIDAHFSDGESLLNGRKSLTLEAQVDGQKITETFKEGDVFVLPRIPPDGVASPKASQSFLVIAAAYGAGSKFVDCTENVRAKITDPYAKIESVTAMGTSDPVPFVTKTLAVTFEFRGRRYLKWMTEMEPGPLLKK